MCTHASGLAIVAASLFAMATKTNKTWPGGPFWDRITKITGEDDPGRLVHLTGFSYSQLTRYRDGKAGKRGPGAADLQKATAVIREHVGVALTMGQLWGAEPIDGIDDPTDEKFSWLIQRAQGLTGGTP